MSDSSSVDCSPNDVATPGANAAAVVTYKAAAPGWCHCISGVVLSYSATPTGGLLTVQDGSGNTVFSLGITAAGPLFLPFPYPKRGKPATDLIITLAAGGSAVTGKLSVLNHWVEQTGAGDI